MREGKWYLEVKVELGGGDRALDSTQKEGCFVRLGWGRREASLNGPAGMDGYSYGYRDKTGEKVALSRPRPYGQPFKSGDVVGMYISLPPLRQPNKKDPHDPAHLHRERIPIDLKGQEVFEILEYPVAKEMVALLDHPTKAEKSTSLPSSNAKKPVTGAKQPDAPAKEKPKPNAGPAMRPLPVLKGSRMAFFVNGVCQGTAFEDIYDFLPLRQSNTHRKSKGRRAKEGVKEHRENPFDDGTLGYYPMISVYNDATAKLNPGPNFDFPPPLDIDALLDGRPQPVLPEAPVKMEPDLAPLDDGKMDVDGEKQLSVPNGQTWRPAIERYPEFMKEQWALDDLEEEEAKLEFEKQKALEEAGVLPGGTKGKGKKSAATTKAATSRKKKTTEDSSKAGTPAPDENSLPVPSTSKKTQQASSRKKAKKSEPQPSGNILQQATEVSTPRSATETPAGTPPPPSISSTAAAAAAAHLHLHHHSISRQDLSNRPSPSPLRQSTAYQEMDFEEGRVPEDRDALPVAPPSAQAPRSRAPPGSKEGRQRAAAAAAAAAHGAVVSLPLASWPHHSPPPPGSQAGSLLPSIRGNPAANLLSLAALATESASAFPASSFSSKPKSSSTMPAPSPLAQYHVPRAVESHRPRSRGDEDEFDDEILAAAGGASESELDRNPMEEEEEEDEDEFELVGPGRPGRPTGYRYPYADEEEHEEDEEGGASAPYSDRDGEEGVTTDGDSLYPYDERRDRDTEMETDYGPSRPHTPA
jgi:COMPASS component BRE2